MRTETVIRLDREDGTNLNDLFCAFNLVGAEGRGEAKGHRTSELTPVQLEAKLIGKVMTGEFTYDDAVKAVEIVRRRALALKAHADDPVFLDLGLQATFANGVKANADLAIRLADKFISDVREDLAELSEQVS